MKTPSTIPALMPRFVTRRALCAAMLWLLFSALNFQLSTLFAQGTDFTYQGHLADSGQPASGIYDFRFSIFDLANGGSAVAGPQTNSAVGVSNGLFMVTLDFGNSFPGADRFLEIAARTNGGGAFATLTPRQKLTATPYAIRAANFSGTVQASQLSGTISSNNIGAGSITTVMLAAGAIGSNQLAAGAVTTAVLADGAVTAAKLASVTVPASLTQFTNPTPAVSDQFGSAVAVMGNDRVIIGAPNDDTGVQNAGAAYLFSANGALLTTFTNPTPADSDQFGLAVAAMAGDRVLVGAQYDDTGAADAGAAYLFNANGTLLTTCTNPTPAALDWFGYSVAAVGSDCLLIGAPYDDTGASDAGEVYLFSTSGALLATFTNPFPAALDFFGLAVTAVGNDRVLIGAPTDDTGGTDAGVAYLFSTNGTLLITFTNPFPGPSEWFGHSVAAMGSDRVLIGAPYDNAGAVDAGTVYLFSTNGTLLAIFNNPTPAAGDRFGYAVAAAGNDRVLIGAYQDDTGTVTNAGVAYLFSADGTLLTTLTNPAAADNDNFGISLAAAGNDRVVIGVMGNDTGATDAGAAYLFNLDTFAPGVIVEGVRVGGVTLESIAAGAVISDHIATAAVGANQLASAAVTTSSLADGAVTTTKLADGAVTAAKLDATIGVWTRSGTNVFRTSGNVGIGTNNPASALQVVGTAVATTFQGSGSGLTGLNAANVSSGTLADARLSGNVAFLNSSPTFAGDITLAGGATYHHLALSGGNALGYLYGSFPRFGDGIHLGYNYYADANGVNHVFNPGGATSRLALGYGFVQLSIGSVGDSAPTLQRLLANSTGVTVNGTFNNSSDRNAKQDFAPVNPAEILDKVATLPLTEWSYKEDATTRHIGPMAQDFYSTFNLGTDDKHIAPMDEGGVALAAIQGLNRKLTEELKRRDAENAELKRELGELKRVVGSLADKLNGGTK